MCSKSLNSMSYQKKRVMITAHLALTLLAMKNFQHQSVSTKFQNYSCFMLMLDACRNVSLLQWLVILAFISPTHLEHGTLSPSTSEHSTMGQTMLIHFKARWSQMFEQKCYRKWNTIDEWGILPRWHNPINPSPTRAPTISVCPFSRPRDSWRNFEWYYYWNYFVALEEYGTMNTKTKN